MIRSRRKDEDGETVARNDNGGGAVSIERGESAADWAGEDGRDIFGDDIFPPPLPSVVLGIPTVPRPKGVSYLERTLAAVLLFTGGEVRSVLVCGTVGNTAGAYTRNIYRTYYTTRARASPVNDRFAIVSRA